MKSRVSSSTLANTATIHISSRPLCGRLWTKIKKCGAKPLSHGQQYPLYSGMRHNAVDHLNVAYLHGFTPAVVDAPVIIADGLFGENDVPVRIDCKHFREVHIADVIRRAPSLTVLSHFKGHEMAGFGGAIKIWPWAAVPCAANATSTTPMCRSVKTTALAAANASASVRKAR